MDEEDWGLSATAPSFTLFKEVSPEEEAKKDSFVDIVVYNHWKKSERRLYTRLKAKRIEELIRQDKLTSMEDISNALGALSLFKNDNEDDPNIAALIGAVEGLKLQANSGSSHNKGSGSR